jgi:peroxiredoxin Q/BCP
MMIRRFCICGAVAMLAVAMGCQDSEMETGSTRDLSNPSPASMEGAASDRSGFVGTTAPAFTLLDQNGDPVKLANFRGQWLVLYFYPADDTPGCICEATEFTNLLVNFENMNARVVGMNNETPSSHRRFIDKYNLEIDLLSDPTQDVLRQYGAWIDPPGRAGRVVRSTFLIGPRGMIRHHWPEVIPTGHAERVQEKLRELRSR